MSQFSTTLLITHLFFLPPLILFYFCNLSFFIFILILSPPHVYLYWVFISFQISKSKSSPYFGQSSRGHPKENSKSLRNNWDKKNEEEEEHQRNTDVVKTTKKNGKLSRKEVEIGERCIRSWNLLRNYLRWEKNYKEICIFVSGRYPFSGRNPIFWLIQSECSRYCRYLNRYEMRSFLYRSRHRYGKYRPYQPVRYEIDYTAQWTYKV